MQKFGVVQYDIYWYLHSLFKDGTGKPHGVSRTLIPTIRSPFSWLLYSIVQGFLMLSETMQANNEQTGHGLIRQQTGAEEVLISLQQSIYRKSARTIVKSDSLQVTVASLLNWYTSSLTSFIPVLRCPMSWTGLQS